MTVSWFGRDTLIAEAQRRIEPVDVVLDIGCGIRPQPYVRPKVLVCVDAHEEYLAILRQRFAGTHTILIEGRVPQCLQWLPDRSVDTAFLLDFIEHLDKDDGRKTIRECERIVRKQIVIFTPLGFMSQGADEDGSDGWALHGGDWQAHRSGWMPQDFDDSWEILAAEAFHAVNGRGEPLDPPFSAFWALKRLSEAAESGGEEMPAIDVLAAGLQEREQAVMAQEIRHRQLQEALERQRQALAREKEHFEKARIVRLVRGIQWLLGVRRAKSTAGGDDSVTEGRA